MFFGKLALKKHFFEVHTPKFADPPIVHNCCEIFFLFFGGFPWRRFFKLDSEELYGKPPKKTGKKVHNSCELWGGVSKFWCVNLKKVLFLELIFQKTC